MPDFLDPSTLSYDRLKEIYRDPGYGRLPYEYQRQVERAMAQARRREAMQQERGEAVALAQHAGRRSAADEAAGKLQESLGGGAYMPPGATPEDLTSAGMRSMFPQRGPMPAPTPESQAPATPAMPSTPQPPGESAGAAPMPPPAAPSPYDSMIAGLLRPSGGGASPLPKIDRIDVKELTSKFPEIPEREKGEVYKSNPYMTMLQTGLRILAAKPELGRSGLGVISEPLAKGVEQYQGEKEKERASRQEEAKESRADLYRRQEAAKSTAALALTALTANQSASFNELKLAQERAQHGETAALKRLELALNAEEKKMHAAYYDALAKANKFKDPGYVRDYLEPIEKEIDRLDAQLRDPNARDKELLTAQRDRLIDHRNFAMGTARETLRADVASERNRQSEINRLLADRARLAPQSMMPGVAEQLARIEADLRALGHSSQSLPTALPAPPR